MTLTATQITRYEQWHEDMVPADNGAWVSYEDHLSALSATREQAVRECAEKTDELEKLRKFAKEATIALTGLTAGGSEYFAGQIGDIYVADIPFCVERIRDRQLRDIERTKSAIRAARSKREKNSLLSLWQFADEAQSALGWSYDGAEIEKVRDAAAKESGYDATLEFTESVMRIANSRLNRLSLIDRSAKT